MPRECRYKIQVIHIPLQRRLSLRLPIGIYSLVLCKSVWRSLLHSVLSLAKRETYFPFPATDVYLSTLWSVAAKLQQQWEKRGGGEDDANSRRADAHTLTSLTIVCLLFWQSSWSFYKKMRGGGGESEAGERKRAAVVDSIRHAGLQCKLLHGHRCGFYGRNTGLSWTRQPMLPSLRIRNKGRGRRWVEGVLP